MQGYVCFDLETTGLLDSNPDVLCASTLKVRVVDRTTGALECEPPRNWHMPLGQTVEPMDRAALAELVAYLVAQDAEGFASVTWNGSSFDFKLLYTLLNDPNIKTLCNRHVDLCFNVFVHKGFPIKLASVACAFECENKSDSGATAPELWASNSQRVIHYCQQDVIVLASVMSCIMATKSVRWISKAGKRNEFRQHFDMMWPMHISSRRRVADNSWMRSGTVIDKDQFVGWLQ